MTTRKFFAALDFTESQRENLSLLANEVECELGSSVGRRVKDHTLHITIGVMEGRVDKEIDLQEMKEVLVGSLHSMGARAIHLSKVGRFDQGAVYVEVEDVEGLLSRLRVALKLWAARAGLITLDLSVYHVTLFKTNTLNDPLSICEGLRRDPLRMMVRLDGSDPMSIHVSEIRSRANREADLDVVGNVQEESVQSIGGTV